MWPYSNHFSACAFRARRDEACSPWDSSPLGSFPSYCLCVLSHSVGSELRPHGLWPTRLLLPGDFPGKNTEVDCHFLLQGIFPTQGSKPHLLHWQTDSLPLGHLGSPSHCPHLCTWSFFKLSSVWDAICFLLEPWPLLFTLDIHPQDHPTSLWASPIILPSPAQSSAYLNVGNRLCPTLCPSVRRCLSNVLLVLHCLLEFISWNSFFLTCMRLEEESWESWVWELSLLLNGSVSLCKSLSYLGISFLICNTRAGLSALFFHIVHFLLKKFYLLILKFIFGCVGSLLLCRGFL